jgi:phosphoglucomutase
MTAIMNAMRENPPDNLGGYKVAAFRDYKTSVIKNLKTGEVSDTGLPVSDVLYFDLENGSKVIIRPSGTEPKIKIYYLISAENENLSDIQVTNLKSAMEKFTVVS